MSAACQEEGNEGRGEDEYGHVGQGVTSATTT